MVGREAPARLWRWFHAPPALRQHGQEGHFNAPAILKVGASGLAVRLLVPAFLAHCP